MKLIYLTFAVLSIGSSALAQSESLADRWPWSWGNECPFPAKSMKGGWSVEARGSDDAHDGHQIWIDIVTDRSTGKKLIRIEQYNRRGTLYAAGELRMEDETIRVVTVPMRRNWDRSPFNLILRAYLFNVSPSARALAPSTQDCSRKRKAFAATFCPIRGTKCREDANYLMERLP